MQEIWKDIPEYEGIYQVSNIGRIKSLERLYSNGHPNSKPKILPERIMALMVSKKGYLRVQLSKNAIFKTFPVHRLVAIAFIENVFNYPEVNHINCFKQDNNVSNLEWVSTKQNNEHARKNNLIKPMCGEKHGMSKLSEQDVLKIRSDKENGGYYKDIANRFNISVTHYYYIINGNSWGHLNKNHAVNN